MSELAHIASMRIIAGTFKGRRLASPRKATIRPTLDRVKESYFRIVHTQVQGANFLDLCAGSGNIGLEALSRGAQHVAFVDQNRQSIRLIKTNLQKCGLTSQDQRIQLLPTDVKRSLTTFSRSQVQFHLIYFDPPYTSDLYLECLTQIAETTVLTKRGIICIEHNQSDFPQHIGGLRLTKEKKYGDTNLSFYQMEV